MSSAILPMLGSAVLFFLYLTLAVILIRKYMATGDVGFVWLVIALVGWPILAGFISGQLSLHFMRAHPVKPNSTGAPNPTDNILTLFNLFQRAIEILLVIFAVRFIGKTEDSKKSAK